MPIYNPPPVGNGSGDMTKAVYDANNDGKVASADSADAVAWTNVSGKPSDFTPSSHTHPQSEITNLTTDLAGKAASTHSHAISDVTGLQTALDGKAASLGADDNYVTDAEKVKLSNLSGTNSGDNATNTQYSGLATSKQDTLVSGTNIKTINSTSLLGSGDISVRNSYTLVATLASPQATGANTTPVSLTGLVFNYEANSKYRIWAMGTITPAAATTGCGFQFDLTTAVTSISVQFYHQLASTGTLTGGHSIADDASVGVSSGTPSTGSYPVTVEGLLITTSNAGSAQMRFRSETTAVITCNSGFTLIVEKIA